MAVDLGLLFERVQIFLYERYLILSPFLTLKRPIDDFSLRFSIEYYFLHSTCRSNWQPFSEWQKYWRCCTLFFIFALFALYFMLFSIVSLVLTRVSRCFRSKLLIWIFLKFYPIRNESGESADFRSFRSFSTFFFYIFRSLHLFRLFLADFRSLFLIGKNLSSNLSFCWAFAQIQLTQLKIKSGNPVKISPISRTFLKLSQ
jgi:hypothetical protein